MKFLVIEIDLFLVNHYLKKWIVVVPRIIAHGKSINRIWNTLSILIRLINQYRQVKIEKLATYFPLPILFESRRKHLQRFLVLTSLSIPLIWFPIIQFIITQNIPLNFPLIIALDRTQWKDKNIFVISLIWSRHGLPIYWNILDLTKI